MLTQSHNLKRYRRAVPRVVSWAWRLLVVVLVLLNPLFGSITLPAQVSDAPHVAYAAPSNFCIAGDFNGWNDTSTPLYDDGTNGDLTAGDGIYSLDVAVPTAGVWGWKVILDCTQGWGGGSLPNDNAWYNVATDGDTITFTFDSNTYNDGFLPSTQVLHATDNAAVFTFNAVGDFNGWNNGDAAATLSDIGNGYYEVIYSVATAGSYSGKITHTGAWDVQFGPEGRSVNAGTVNFSTTADGQSVRFVLDLNTSRIKVDVLSAAPTWCVAGDFQGWNNAAHMLFDDGTNGDTAAGDGIYTAQATIADSADRLWKIVACGDWSTTYPADNSWMELAGLFQDVTFTLDTNTYADGYVPTTNIPHAANSLNVAEYSAVGDFNGWNNNDGAAVLTDLGGGMFSVDIVQPTAGTYNGKIVKRGSWDAFGLDGRSVNAGNVSYTTVIDSQTVRFRLNTNTGRMMVEPILPADVWCAVGDFNGWDTASHPLNDLGLNGDATVGDNVYSRQETVTTSGFQQWKVTSCGSWDTTYPSGANNAWFQTNTADQAVTFTLDTNSYADGYVPAANIQHVLGGDVPAAGFTAVGDWQVTPWTNNDPATALADMGGGIYELTYTIPTAGTYMGKFVITGSWDGFDAQGSHIGTPDNINFTTGGDNEDVIFTIDLNTGRVKIEPQGAPPPPAVWCVAGQFQSWNENTHPMVDDGTNGDAVAGDGIYSRQQVIANTGDRPWKVVECGNWSVSYPANNAFVNLTAPNQTVLFTFDTNTYLDGFLPQSNIVHADDDLGTAFTAVGDFNGWNNADPTTALSDIGGGFYEATVVIPTAGGYIGKITMTGSWDAFGADGRSGDAANVAFATNTADEPVTFTLDTNTSRLKITPSSAPPPVWDSVYHSSCASRIAATCAGDGDHAGVEEVPGMAGTTFSSVQIAGAPVGSGVTDAYAYDDEPVTMYMVGDQGDLTDDGQYPFIRAWIDELSAETLIDMSQVGTYSGTFRSRPGSYDIFQGSLPAQRPGNIYYWLTAQENDQGGLRALCMGGNPENALGQPLNAGDCSFNDYALAFVDDDTTGPTLTNVVFSDGGTGLGGGDDQVCADAVEDGTASGDNDSNVASVTLLYSANLADIIIGSGTPVTMTFTGGSTYCATGLSFSDPTYYRVEAANDDQDHPDDGDYTDVDVSRSTAACEGAACDFPTGDNNIHWNEVLHDTRDAYYRDPFGAVPTGSTVTLRLRTALDDLTFAFVQVYNTPSGAQAYAMTKVSSDATYDYYEVTIPAAATADANQLYYMFTLMDTSVEDWYIDDHTHDQWDHEDLTENGTGLMVDDGLDGAYANNSFTLTVYDAAFTTPAWAQNAVIYQIMPDRFRNGDPSNDEAWPYGDVYGTPTYLHPDWNEAPVNPRDDTSPFYNQWSADFFGGDLQGIMDELDYLQSIGVTTIYLNPIFASPSNHGYDTTDYLQINPRYGDNALFAQFAAEAEERGITIILDGVFNHSGSDSVYFDRYNRWDANGNPVTGNDGSGACEAAGSAFNGMYNLIDDGLGPCYDGHSYESWWGYDSLPLLIDGVSGNDVRDFVFDEDNDGSNGLTGDPGVVQYWYSMGADGWRFDVADDIPHDFWIEFREQVKGNDGYDGPLFSEVWYEAQPWILGDQLDASMNYRYRKAVLGFLADSDWTDNDNNGGATMAQLSPSEFDYALGSIREDYPAPALYTMMNLMGSHDTNRALFVLDEQSASTPDAVAKLKMMAALQFTYIGSPTIYYGDEAALGASSYGGYGLWGAGYGDPGSMQDDPYNRHSYPWDPDFEDDYNTWSGSGLFEFDSVDGPVPPTETYTAEVRAHYQILGLTRSNYPVLRSGDVVTLLTDDANNVYAYARVDGTGCAIAIFNRGAGVQNVTLNGLLPAECTGTFYDVLNGGAAWTVAGGSLTVNGIPGLTSAVLVPALGTNGLVLPPAVVETDSVAISIKKNESTQVSALVFDVAGQSLPAGVTVDFALVSGGGGLSSGSAVTDGTGVAAVTYTGANKFDVAVIQARITAPNGITYTSSTVVFVGFKADAINRLSVDTGIGPHFVDGFTAGLDVAATKVGTGEPVVSLGQYQDNPYQKGSKPVMSTFVDVNLSDAADVDMLAVRVRYFDEVDEANHQLYWWDGKGWIATSAVFVDTDLNEVTLEVTNSSTPSLNDLHGTVMVVGDPGYYNPNAPAEDEDETGTGGSGDAAAGSVPEDVTALPSTGYAPQDDSQNPVPTYVLIVAALGVLTLSGAVVLFRRQQIRG